MADQLTKQCFSHPLVGSVPALDVSADVAKRVIGGSISTKHTHYRQFVCGQRQSMGYLTRSST